MRGLKNTPLQEKRLSDLSASQIVPVAPSLQCQLHSTPQCPKLLRYICIKPNCKFRYEPICEDCIVLKHKGNRNQKYPVTKLSGTVIQLIETRVSRLRRECAPNFQAIARMAENLQFIEDLAKEIRTTLETIHERYTQQCEQQISRLKQLKQFAIGLSTPLPLDKLTESTKRYQTLIIAKQHNSVITQLHLKPILAQLERANALATQVDHNLKHIEWHIKIPLQFQSTMKAKGNLDAHLVKKKNKPKQEVKTCLVRGVQRFVANKQGDFLKVQVEDHRRLAQTVTNLRIQLAQWHLFTKLSIKFNNYCKTQLSDISSAIDSHSLADFTDSLHLRLHNITGLDDEELTDFISKFEKLNTLHVTISKVEMDKSDVIRVAENMGQCCRRIGVNGKLSFFRVEMEKRAEFELKKRWANQKIDGLEVQF